MEWVNVGNLQSIEYTCGHCGKVVATRVGYYTNEAPQCTVRICPHCTRPTFFDGGKQLPGVAPGSEVSNVPTDVDAMYREARNCIAVASYTAAVLACRKLLMHLAVTQGANPGDSFISYVDI